MVVERIEIAGLLLELERPDDPESLIDEDTFANDEFLPYWAELWPSGVGLAHHVSTLSLAGLDVLELGCGLGLPSLVAASLGANVVASDWSAEAITLLERNAARNGVALTARLADWGEPTSLRERPAHLVLAADVLYEARNAAPLVETLAAVLAPGGVALVADPGRRHAPAFLELARERFVVAEIRGDWGASARLYRLARPV